MSDGLVPKPAYVQYPLGFSETRIAFQGARRAATHAGFLFPLLKVKPDVWVLDCGCGTGSISNDLAKAVPGGMVIGIDTEVGQIQFARRVALTEEIRNAFYEQQNVLELEFAENTFDVVFGNAILDYVANNIEQALAQMLRVLKPGGCLALRSPDWSQLRLEPFSAETDYCMQQYQALINTSGGNGQVISTVDGYLSQLGANDIRKTTSSEIHADPVLMTDVVAETLLDPEKQKKIPNAEPNEIAKSCAGMSAWARTPNASIQEFWAEIVAIKPQ